MTTQTARQRVRGSGRQQARADEKLSSWIGVFEADPVEASQTHVYPGSQPQPSDVWAMAFALTPSEGGRLTFRYPSPSLDEYMFSSGQELQYRLDNANDYFRRKASEVLNDEEALQLLVALYESSVVEIVDINWCKYGIPLGKLTAANFCQIGNTVIYITDSGYRFIDSIK